MRDPDTGNSRGFGFISYDSFEASDAAVEAMNGQYLCNRQITVSYAYKKDTKGERHGTPAERVLASSNPNVQKSRPHTLFASGPPTLPNVSQVNGSIAAPIPPRPFANGPLPPPPIAALRPPPPPAVNMYPPPMTMPPQPSWQGQPPQQGQHLLPPPPMQQYRGMPPMPPQQLGPPRPPPPGPPSQLGMMNAPPNVWRPPPPPQMGGDPNSMAHMRMPPPS